jgi:YHS domain-containing protein
VLWLEDGQFKEATAMVVDPVCQMRTEQGAAVAAVWDGERFSFCSRGCRDEFLAAPYRFFADAEASGPHEAALREAVRREAALAGARK